MIWSCPHCATAISVTDQNVGNQVKCPKCGESSVVESQPAENSYPSMPPTIVRKAIAKFAADDEKIPDSSATAPTQITPALQPEKLTPMTTVVKYFLCLLLALNLLAIIVAFNGEPFQSMRWMFFTTFIGLLAQSIILIPFLKACDDIVAIRKILEESTGGTKK